MGHRDDEALFWEGDLRLTLERQHAKMLQSIERYEANKLLNSNRDDLVAYFVAEHRIEPLVIDEGSVTVDQSEVQVDVSHRFEYGGFGGEQIIVPGTQITFHVPYSGERDLFKLRPSTFTTSSPHARVSSTELVFTYTKPNAEPQAARKFFDEAIQSVRQFVGWSGEQIGQFNRDLERQAREAIDGRRGRLLENQSIVASLGFPLRMKADAPRTYALPNVRKKAVPQPPPASSAPYVPEPALDDASYAHILAVFAGMVRVMEASPEAFSDMNEPDLRMHFLVQLNGQFEQRASAETFRGSGKTDILLEERDRGVFIAECKFWDGPKSLLDALDQLLDYATWRDAKAAVLVFNRNADFSGVVQQIGPTIRQHKQVRGEVRIEAETVFRFGLRQRDDSAREMTVTVMVFNVPTRRTASARLQPRKGRGTKAS